jgi:Ca-activated chloride channel homolog
MLWGTIAQSVRAGGSSITQRPAPFTRSREFVMRRNLLVIAVLVAFGCQAHAAGMLIPVEKKLPPLAMLDHKVQITIEDQVATTTIEQTFRNNTSRQLEATYLLPVPKGANVKEFFMWVGGNKVKGELVEADKARKIYTDIVSRTKDPGLLEYVGTNLLRMKVFPVPANGDQKVAVTYSYLANNDGGLVEYIYPLRTDGKAATTLDKFSISVKLKSQHPITNIYSPSHAITVSRPNDKEATIGFEKDQAVLDKDFQLFYTPGNKDVGLTALTHRRPERLLHAAGFAAGRAVQEATGAARHDLRARHLGQHARQAHDASAERPDLLPE